jgi:hypothetical protein
MTGGDTSLILQVGTFIRVTEGNVLGGYKKGHTGKVVSVLENSFTHQILYRCEMSGPRGTDALILLPSEIEPLPDQSSVRVADGFFLPW